MIPRYATSIVQKALTREAAVALIGPRQVGKTTLAFLIGEGQPSIYLDLEARGDREKLSDPVQFLRRHTDKLVILDEIHRVPTLFEALRGIIDEGRRIGKATGRFLLLGSANIDLMRQSETLAGRIEYVDLGILNALEIKDYSELEKLWLRGGFPRSFLAADDEDSYLKRQNFVRTYLERDIPLFGPRIASEMLERLWIMLAHHQGAMINQTDLSRSLGVSVTTIKNYIDLLTDLLLVRQLHPYATNVSKRLVKTPKTFIRDSGLVHALLGIETFDELLGHPIVGASWEGFVIENLLSAAPFRTLSSFYRTARGAEIDLVLEHGGKHGLWAIEVKKGFVPKMQKGFLVGLEDIQPKKAFIVYGGKDRFPKSKDVEVISLIELCQELSNLV